MNLWKRAWVSITRRKLNSLVLLLIVFILANVLLITLTVTSSLKDTKKMVLNQFPPVVTVDYNPGLEDANAAPTLTAKKADSLYAKTKDMVKSYDYSVYIIMQKNEDTQLVIIPSGNKEEEESRKEIYGSHLTLTGTQLPTTGAVAKKEAQLISGKGFDDKDIKEGKPKIIVSKQFAEANQLTVGSTLNVSRILSDFVSITEPLGEPYFSEDLELEVKGIIEISKVEEFIKKAKVDTSLKEAEFNEMDTLINTIYAPDNYIYPLLEDNAKKGEEHYGEVIFNIPGTSANMTVNPEYVLKDMEDLDEFLVQAKQVYNEKYFTVTSAALEYDTIAAPMNSMEELLDLVFKITVFASIVVLTLVLYIFMYLRQKEMGIFLALGERKTKIVGQLIVETMIITLIGATLAIFTSMIFSNMLTDNTIASLLTPTKEMSQTISSMNSTTGITPEMISSQVQGGFSAMTFVIFYGTTILTILISQIATVLYLIRLNPKKILM